MSLLVRADREIQRAVDALVHAVMGALSCSLSSVRFGIDALASLLYLGLAVVIWRGGDRRTALFSLLLALVLLAVAVADLRLSIRREEEGRVGSPGALRWLFFGGFLSYAYHALAGDPSYAFGSGALLLFALESWARGTPPREPPERLPEPATEGA